MRTEYGAAAQRVKSAQDEARHACSGFLFWQDARKPSTNASIKTSSASSERLGPALEALRRIDNRVHIVEARPWLGLHRLRSEHGNPLPADLTKPGAIALPFEAELFPEELAGRLTAVIGVPVVLVGDAPTSTDGASTVPASWRPEAEPAEGAPVQWSGPLDELLNAWTSAYGYDWRYEEGAIRILRTVTALLRVNALAGSRQLSTSIGTQSEASGGTGASAGASSSQRLAGGIRRKLLAPGAGANRGPCIRKHCRNGYAGDGDGHHPRSTRRGPPGAGHTGRAEPRSAAASGGDA